MERLGALASRVQDAHDRQQLLDFLRDKNVQVRTVSSVGSFQNHDKIKIKCFLGNRRTSNY